MTGDETDRSPLSQDEWIAEEAAKHPIRVFIATLLSNRSMTANEVAKVTELPANTVRRHLRAMRDSGTIELVETRKRRGTAEQVYEAKRRFLISREQVAKMTTRQRRQINAYLLRASLSEASRSLVTNPSQRALERDDFAVARIPTVLDEEGWSELAEMHADFINRVVEFRERIKERVEKSDLAPIRATSVVLWFELNPEAL